MEHIHVVTYYIYRKKQKHKKVQICKQFLFTIFSKRSAVGLRVHYESARHEFESRLGIPHGILNFLPFKNILKRIFG